jgi:hypothetical protein
MPLLESLKGLFTKEAAKYVYLPIARDHVNDPKYAPEPLEAGKHYFRLWLAEMYLKKEVDWFKTWHPVVHSLVRFQFGTQTVEIPHVAGATQLKDVTEHNLEKVISLNYPMTTLMPFNGGVVEVMTALLAMEGKKNFVNSVIKVLGDLSGLLVVPQLSAALAVAQPIANGVQDLLAGQNGSLHLGLHQAFTSEGGGGDNELRPGYIAVILGTEQGYSKDEIWVEQDRLRKGKSFETSRPLIGVTYMLFRIESRLERDDWRGLTNIAEAFQEALKNLLDEDTEKAELSLKKAILLVRASPDLTKADRTRISLALKEEFEEAKTSGLGAVAVEERSLEAVIQRRASSVEDAASEGEPSLEKLFGTSE